MKNRREFLRAASAAALALIAVPRAAIAQKTTRLKKIGYLCPYGAVEHGFAPFRDGLAEFGYVVGRNIEIESSACSMSGSRDDFEMLAREMIRSGIDIIVAPGSTGIRAAISANRTRKIPLVFLGVDDPVAMGLITTLSRPGANITGLSTMSPALAAKRVELMKEIVPALARLGLLVNPASAAAAPANLRETESAARALRVDLHRIDVHAGAELQKAFHSMAQAKVGAVIVSPDPMFFEFRSDVAALALKNRMPLMSQERAFVDEGGLIAYGPSLAYQHRRAAYYVDKILKGAKPGDLPVELPTTFELVVNTKSAKALGITIPKPVLLRADKLVQ